MHRLTLLGLSETAILSYRSIDSLKQLETYITKQLPIKYIRRTIITQSGREIKRMNNHTLKIASPLDKLVYVIKMLALPLLLGPFQAFQYLRNQRVETWGTGLSKGLKVSIYMPASTTTDNN